MAEFSDDHRTMERYGSDDMAAALGILGARYLFVTPGASFRGLHDSVVHGASIGDELPELVLCLHEAVAVAAAHGYAKATRGAAHVALHDLVGLMNAQMAIYNAWADRAPVVIVGGGGPIDPSRRRWIDWLHSAAEQGELVRPFVKHVEDPYSIADVQVALARSQAVSLTEPRGPSYVTLDIGLQESMTSDPPVAADVVSRLAQPLPASVPKRGDVDAAAQLLLDAQLPVIVAGRTGLDREASSRVVALAETLGAGFVDERNFSGIATDHELNMSRDPSLVADADAVLAVDVVNLHQVLGGRPHVDQRLIRCGYSTPCPPWGNAFRNETRARVDLPGEPAETLSILLSAIQSSQIDHDLVRRRTVALQERRQTVLASGVRKQAAPEPTIDGAVTASQMVEALWRGLRQESWLLAARNGRSWPEGIWKFSGGSEFLGHSGGGGVGYSTAAAVGAAFAARDRGQVAVAIVGDGDLAMSSSALWTAAHYRLPLLLVINNNRAFMNSLEHQRTMAAQRRRSEALASVGTVITDPVIDFAHLADGYGMRGYGPIARADQLVEAVADAVRCIHVEGMPVLIDVITVPSGDQVEVQ